MLIAEVALCTEVSAWDEFEYLFPNVGLSYWCLTEHLTWVPLAWRQWPPLLL